MAEIATTTSTGTEVPHVTLYWLDKSRSQRILWLLEECKGLTYDIEVFKRGADKLAPAELKTVHPLGKSPVITVKASPTSTPITIAESGTMTEYLCQYFAPQLVPKRYKDGQEGKICGETEEYLRYMQLMHYAEGSLMAILVMGVLIDGIREAPVPFFVKPLTRGVAGRVDDAFLTRNYENHFTYLNSLLETSEGEYLCGKKLTAVDILMSFPVIAAGARHGYDKYPKLKAYREMIKNESGFKRSVEVIEKRTGEKFQENL
ncbi:hypothetical protein AMS68_002052 [Peltaster fructicola]|uniref:GST N-terminal domain-containing protein n=1 Tax=Peltaster fructicola TaxID=286661 RepID=A0A6H0XPH6_9PEZI|nr:hypothetical protein AMS68_002052 [Peltaster fructicola]